MQNSLIQWISLLKRDLLNFSCYTSWMTIYALSSGPGLSGVAVIRISGPDTKKVLSKLTNGDLPKPRVATLKKINKINTNELIDEGIMWFPGTTQEDMAEFMSMVVVQ